MNGELQSVSPSQIKTFLDCPLKWYHDKVLGIKVESTKPQDEGTRLHEQMEKWFLNGDTPKHKSGLVALSLVHVPTFDSKPVIEEPRDYAMNLIMAGVKVKGRIDLRAPPVNGHFFVLDWKSCKNFTYCHSPETLARDPQGIIYLQYGFQLYTEAKTADFRHVYLRTQEPFGAKAVVTDPFTRDQVQDVFGHLEKTVSEMKALAAEKDANQVPFDKTSCSKYGGCPYKNVCPAVERFNPLMIRDMNETPTPNPEMSSLARKLAERRKPSGIINPPDAAPPYEVKPYDPTYATTKNMLLAGTSADPAKIPTENPPDDRSQGVTLDKAFANMQAQGIRPELLERIKNDAKEALAVMTDNHGPCDLHEIVTPEVNPTRDEGKPRFVLCIDTVPNSDNVIDLEQHVVKAVRNSIEALKNHPDFDGKMILVQSKGLSGLAVDILSPLATQVFRGR